VSPRNIARAAFGSPQPHSPHVATVFIAGEGHWITGGLIMVFAYAVSLFVTHWLFKIVKPKLLTLLWFARGWARFVTIRNKTLRWLVKSANLPLRSQ
jgi:hypothetical protein